MMLFYIYQRLQQMHAVISKLNSILLGGINSAHIDNHHGNAYVNEINDNATIEEQSDVSHICIDNEIGIEKDWIKYNGKPLEISSQEWNIADKIMKEVVSKKLPLPFKIDKAKYPELNHSFIVLNEKKRVQCFAVSRSKNENEGVLGYGKQGVWKILQSKNGSQIVMKIEPFEKSHNHKILEELNGYIGFFTRERENSTRWVQGREKVKTIKDKQYSIFKKIDGDTLSSYVKNEIDEKKLCNLAYQSAIAVRSLHKKNLIHGDIHGSNIMVDKENQCNLVDFGTLCKLEKEPYIKLKKPVGSRNYMAPEVGVWNKEEGHWIPQESRISLASDIYSLARMFEKDLKLSKTTGFNKLIKRMKSSDPSKRPNINRVIHDINKIRLNNTNENYNKPALTISVGQALSLLIKHYDTFDPNYSKQLKKMYILGVRTEEDNYLFNEIKKDPLLKGYDVSDNYRVISDDASRRYFETHLSFETMKNSIKNYPLETIQKYYDSIKSCFEPLGGDIDFQKFKKTGEKKIKRNYKKEMVSRINDNMDPNDLIKGISKEEQKAIDKLFSGYIPNPHDKKFNDPMYMEYADLINRIKENKYLTNEDKEKALLIIKSTRLSMILSNKMEKYKNKGTYDGELMPGGNIYKSGIYLPENRGRIAKSNSPSNSHNMGLLLKDMPLDKNDEAYAERAFPYPKPSDKATFDENSDWVKYAMEQKTHTFSNSISGTLLAQLRMMLKLHKEDKLSLKEKEEFANHFRSIISLMTYMTGGHSLLEFTAPLQLEKVIKEFKFIDGFSDLSLESLFYTNNEVAYENALKKTQKYNDKYIKISKRKKDKYFREISQLKESSLLKQFKLSKTNNELITDNKTQTKLTDYSYLDPNHILQSPELVAMMKEATGKNGSDLVVFNSERALLHEVAAFVTTFIKTNNESHRNQIIRTIVDSLLNDGLSELDDRLKGVKQKAIQEVHKIFNGNKKGSKIYRDAISNAKKMKLPCDYCKGIDSIEKLATEIAFSELAKKEQQKYFFEKISNKSKENSLFQHRYPNRSDKPAVMFVAGGQGSGKGTSINSMLYEAEKKGLDPKDIVYLNNDSYKDLLKTSEMNPKLFSQLTHTEAKLIRDKAYKYAKKNKMHLLLDQVSPSISASNYAQSNDSIIQGAFISTKVDKAIERSFKRGRDIGRFEDAKSILECHKRAPQDAQDFLIGSVGKKAHVDFYDNNDQSTLFMSVDCMNKNIVIQDVSLLKRFIQKRYININAKKTDDIYRMDKISDAQLDIATNNWLETLFKKGYSVKNIPNINNVRKPNKRR